MAAVRAAGSRGSALTSHFQNRQQRLPDIAPLRQLSRSVFAVLGMNPGPYSLTGTNTYLVGVGAKRILIDTGEGRPEYIANLQEALRLLKCGLQEIVVTHWHHDHLGGVPSVTKHFGEVPVRKFLPDETETLFDGEGAIDPYSIWPRDRFAALRDGEVLKTEGATLRVMHTPGHANDHVVLIHEEDRAMFTADNVLGVGTAVFRDLPEYLASLQRMLAAVQSMGLTRLHPAHGPALEDAPGILSEYIAHRMERVEQVRNALVSHAGVSGTTAESIARRLYDNVPDNLIKAAAVNTTQALLKLERDGVARRLDSAAPPGLARWSPVASATEAKL